MKFTGNFQDFQISEKRTTWRRWLTYSKRVSENLFPRLCWEALSKQNIKVCLALLSWDSSHLLTELSTLFAFSVFHFIHIIFVWSFQGNFTEFSDLQKDMAILASYLRSFSFNLTIIILLLTSYLLLITSIACLKK